MGRKSRKKKAHPNTNFKATGFHEVPCDIRDGMTVYHVSFRDEQSGAQRQSLFRCVRGDWETFNACVNRVVVELNSNPEFTGTMPAIQLKEIEGKEKPVLFMPDGTIHHVRN